MKITERRLRQIISETLIAEIVRSDGSLQGMLGAIEQYKNHTWVFFDTETTGLRPRSLKRSAPETGPQLVKFYPQQIDESKSRARSKRHKTS